MKWIPAKLQQQQQQQQLYISSLCFVYILYNVTLAMMNKEAFILL